MRRRERLDIWPSLADLMTVLAVPALCIAVGRVPGSFLVCPPTKPGAIPVENIEMTRAINAVESFTSALSTGLGLKRQPDQSLLFGEDLLTFKQNKYVGKWKSDGRKRFRSFCEALTGELNVNTLGTPYMELITIEVEGHADASTCGGNAECNWGFSAGRAAWFIQNIREQHLCPGGTGWNVQPTGHSTKDPRNNDDENRRIAVRIRPNYQAIVKRFSDQG